MIIIRHAWLNLKRNRFSHLKAGSFILLILLIVFSLLQIYRMATVYFLDYREQAATVVKGVQELNQTGQANKMNPTDYERLKNLSYVKKSQLLGQGIAASTLVQPKEKDQTTTGFYSFPPDQTNGNYLSVTMLDNDSLKTLLTNKKEKLQGSAPLKENTCVISRSLAKANKLKLKDTILLGTKGQEQKVTIVGIAEFSTAEWLTTSSTVLINWKTGTAMEGTILQTISNVMFQLTSKKEIKNFVKDFKKTKSFKDFSLISQGWSQGILQSVKDTIDLLFNGLIVALILGIVLIAVIYQLTVKRRQDFYTLYLMGMDQRTLALSSSLENVMLILGITLAAVAVSQQLSKWITGEWLIKLQKSLTDQEPFVDWLFPHVDQTALGLNSWSDYLGFIFLGLYLVITLLLVNLRIAKIVREPLQEVAKR